MVAKNGEIVSCVTCKKGIYRKRSEISKNNYCSVQCRRIHDEDFNCLYCGLKQRRRRYLQKYCNSSHQVLYEYKIGLRDKKKITSKANEEARRKGKLKFETNPSVFVSKRGYRMIYIPQRGYVKEHHYIWENNYGQVLNGYVIHHINHNKLDNRIENLQMLTKSAHHKLHDRLRKRDKQGHYL